MSLARGDIWLVHLDPTRGREQRGTRPALVLSADKFNQGPADLVIVLPLTTVGRGIRSHVRIERADSGLDHDSYILCEQVRCVAKERLTRRVGRAPYPVMAQVSLIVRVLLQL